MNSFANKKILIIGATGLVGSHLTVALLKEGAIVYAMGRSKGKLETVFSEYIDNSCIKFVEGNISSGIDESIGEMDYIFHAASPISGDEIREMPVDTISVNIDGARNCLEFLKKQFENSEKKGRLMIFSSATVYGNQIDREMVVKEDETGRADALHTSNTPYSESKRMIEVMAKAYEKQYGIDVAIVRIGYVYGYSNSMPNTAFYEFIKHAINGEDIVLNNSGMGRRDNIYVDDVVDGLIRVALSGESGESYNISSNGDMDNYSAIDEMALMIADSANKLQSENRIKAIVKPMVGERKPGMRLENSKIKSLGWSVSTSLEDGIKKTVANYMNIG